jgi:hypothetical protein
MNNLLKTILFLQILLFPSILYSADWEPLGMMNVGGMNVKIYVDRSSVQEVEENNEYKKSWVKFELPRNTKSNYSDDLYRSRKELYFFHCPQSLYTVTHVMLLDDKDQIIYDSGAFDPFSDDFENAWKLITPISGPDLVNTYVCKLNSDNTETGEKVPEWMRKKEKKSIEPPLFSKSTENEKNNLKEIRWAIRDDGSERLVFDIYKGGEKVSKPTNYKVIDEARDNAIDILFLSFENAGTNLPDLKQSKIIKEIIISNDDEERGVNIKLMLKSSPAYKVFEVENPGRLVIDFKPAVKNP